MATPQDVRNHVGPCVECDYHQNTDCSEIAESLLSSFPQGRILEFRRADGGEFVVPLYGGSDFGMDYHQVFVLDGMAFDPRYAAGECGVPIDEYRSRMRSLNDTEMAEGWL